MYIYFLFNIIIIYKLYIITAKDNFDSIYTTYVLIQSDIDIKLLGISSYDMDWGGTIVSKNKAFEPVPFIFNRTEPYGCNDNISNESILTKTPFIKIVERGYCEFSQKAYIAQKEGALGIIIMDTIESKYNSIFGNNTYYTRINNIKEKTMEYKTVFACEQENFYSDKNITFPLVNQNTNVYNCHSNNKCQSNICIPSTNDTNSNRKFCCIWDIPDPLGINFSSFNFTDKLNIPIVRLSIDNGKRLLLSLPSNGQIYKRPKVIVDPSQVLLWLFAIFVIIVGSYRAVIKERKIADFIYNKSKKYCLNGLNEQCTNSDESPKIIQNLVGQEHPRLELNKWHALAFIIFGSGALLLLFYFNIAMIIIVLFGIGSISAVATVCIHPLLLKLVPIKYKINDTIITCISYLISICIIIIWFLYRNKKYSWILQDLLGFSVCSLFLITIQLPNIKIGSILLILVFLYDIFFVFISPYIFDDSVMLRAANGGNQEAPSSYNYCLRYPTDKEYNCQQESIPILIRFPTILSWQRAKVMLGLGDIVLPGLLLVFCARYDYLTRGNLIRHRSLNDNTINESQLQSFKEKVGSKYIKLFGKHGLKGPVGYFFIISIGYSIGLLLANLGVILMETGQPALLYLVPCTLGVLVCIAYTQNHLKFFWNGPIQFQPLTPEVYDNAGVNNNTEKDLNSSVETQSLSGVHVALETPPNNSSLKSV